MLASAVSAATTTVYDPMQCLGYDAWMAVIDTSDQWEVLAAGMVYGDMEYGQPEGDMDLSFYLDKDAGQQNIRFVFVGNGANFADIPLKMLFKI